MEDMNKIEFSRIITEDLYENGEKITRPLQSYDFQFVYRDFNDNKVYRAITNWKKEKGNDVFELVKKTEDSDLNEKFELLEKVQVTQDVEIPKKVNKIDEDFTSFADVATCELPL